MKEEQILHKGAARLLDWLGIVWFPVPNGMHAASERTVRNMKRRGEIKPGVTDIVVLWTGPDGEARVGFIELKSLTGTYRDDQTHFRNYVLKAGAKWGSARDLKQFHQVLVDFGIPQAIQARVA